MTATDELARADAEAERDENAARDAAADPTVPPAPDVAPDAGKKGKRTRGDAAPRTKPPGKTRVTLKMKLQSQIESLGGLLMVGGMATSNTALMADGQLISEHAAAQADALDKLAKASPAVKRALEALVTASLYGELAAAFLPVVIGIAANHGVLGAPGAGGGNALAQVLTGAFAGGGSGPDPVE
jgi:hypothetical protein